MCGTLFQIKQASKEEAAAVEVAETEQQAEKEEDQAEKEEDQGTSKEQKKESTTEQ